MSKNNTEVVHEGWLIKSPPMKRIWRARWRRRWFTLRHSGELPGQFYLEYYTDRNCRNLKGTIDLDQCEQVDTGLHFEQRKLKYRHMFDVKTPSRIYYLAAESEEDMNSWVDCICQVCGLKAYINEDQDVEVTESHDLVSMIQPEMNINCIPETPPLSPVSGPYIPISECITGRPLTTSLGMQDFKSLLLRNANNMSLDSSTLPLVPPTPQKRKKQMFNSASDIPNELDPRFYDFPRRLQPHTPGSTRHDNMHFERSSTPPLQSPTDSESVFTDDEWSHPVLPLENGLKVCHPSESSNEIQMSVVQSFSKVTVVDEAPPRPPKPIHLGKPTNYLNIEGASNSKINESEAKPTDKPINDEMYDFPRSHNINEPESSKTILSTRHCYNNAAPSTVDGQIFRYELSETEGLAALDQNADEVCEEPASPCSQSSCSTTALYSNLPSPSLTFDSHGTVGPPVVNRGLKPGRKLSDSSLPEPPSPKPTVDRKLKPSTQMLRKTMDSETDCITRIQRAAPSPNPDNEMSNEEIYFFKLDDQFLALPSGMKDLDTLQYLDLDLESEMFSGNVSTSQVPKSMQPVTVYKTVDFVKTEALKSTRQHVEAERKQCSVEP